MIILLGFTASGNYPARYEADEADALRIAQFCDHPVRPGVIVTARVTFLHEGLTDAALDENFKRARDDAAEHDAQLDFSRG